MEKWLKKVEMRGIILTWAVNLPYKSEFKEMKSCISALMLYVTQFVIFVGIAFMEKMVSQFSAKK